MRLKISPLLLERKIRQMLLANFCASAAVGIASILIPWLFIKESSSNTFTILATITIFLIMYIMPMIGRIIDRGQRTTVLMTTSTCGCLLFCALAFLPIGGMIYLTSLLVAYVLMQVYFNFYYTARGALAQSLTVRENYGKLNGWLEVENQIAAFSAGTIAVLLLDILPMEAIFIVCALSLALSAFLFGRIDEPVRPLQAKKITAASDDLNFNKALIYLVTAGNIPFICVMLLNIIKPVFVADVLKSDAQSLALVTLSYTVGAILTGAFSGMLLTRIDPYVSLVTAVCGFVLVTAFLIFEDGIVSLCVVSVGWGVFNSLSRISRQTIAMELVSNDVIGRFIAYTQRINLFIRGVVIISYTTLFLYVDYAYSFWFLTVFAAFGPMLLLYQQQKHPLDRTPEGQA
ncbi:MFS transporter [Terasakiella pusilla]|uniref:MFS transporter n=1 Tax=Terasakiella pusilla TaxID=64973 RepID=UPI00048E81D0|nr:MFS transporter [Terasakiella pusilla]